MEDARPFLVDRNQQETIKRAWWKNRSFDTDEVACAKIQPNMVADGCDSRSRDPARWIRGTCSANPSKMDGFVDEDIVHG